MNIKKIIALLLVAISVFAFSGCNSKAIPDKFAFSITLSESKLFKELNNYEFTADNKDKIKLHFSDNGIENKEVSAMEYSISHSTNIEVPSGKNNSHNEPTYFSLFFLNIYKISDLTDDSVKLYVPEFYEDKKYYTKEELKPYLIYEDSNYLVYDFRTHFYSQSTIEEFVHSVISSDQGTIYEEKNIVTIYNDIKKIISNTN